MSPNKVQNEELQIDMKKWFFKLLSYWWLFGLSLALAISGAYLYLRYSVFQYEAKATLLIKTGNMGLSEERILVQDQGLIGGSKTMTNEIEILKSKNLMRKVADRLQINVEYFKIGRIKDLELYHRTPILLDSFHLHKKDTTVLLFVDFIDRKRFDLAFSEEEEKRSYQYGVPIRNQFGYFLLNTPDSIDASNPKGNYRIHISPLKGIANGYKSKLKVRQVGDQWSSNVLELGLRDPVAVKAEDILNTLVQVYNEEEINDENQVLRNTLDFIDKRLVNLERELDDAEQRIQNFKQQNAIVSDDASANTEIVFQELSRLEQRLGELTVNREILQLLEGHFISSETRFQLIPASLISNNQSLANLIQQYNDLLLQRDKLAVGATAQNPRLVPIDGQLADLQNAITLMIRNLRREVEIPIAQTEDDIARINSNIRSVPSKERQLIDRKRQQTIKENLYLYLLQKREETALSEAVTAPSTRIIDFAESSSNPVSPNAQLIYLGFFVPGLLIPFTFLMLREYLNDRIESVDIIKKLTSIPLIGRIGLQKGDEKMVVKSGSVSAVTEMFRTLRTNLNYFNSESEKQILLITSSLGGEGKTFITINLGLTMALSNKKVLLIGLDLRKPKLAKYLGVNEGASGITDFLIGEKSIEDIIVQMPDNKQLSFITSGPVPPNPAELIMNGRLGNAIQRLKDSYDCILIDTPPIGLVSDALLINKMVSQSLIVVRHKYSRMEVLEMLESIHQEGKFVKPGIVYNGVNNQRGYRYGYGYGYGYGYYSNDK